MKWNPYLNAAGAAAYVFAVVYFLHFIESLRHNTPDTIVDGMGFISLFVFSAAVMAFLFFYRPALLLVEGKMSEAVAYFLKTLGAFGAVTVVMLALVSLQPSPWVKSGDNAYVEQAVSQTIEGTWECLPPKDPNAPHTLECALGIAAADGHYAVDTRLMETYPVDYPVGTKLRISGMVTPVEWLSSIQKYDIVGVISATDIQKI